MYFVVFNLASPQQSNVEFWYVHRQTPITHSASIASALFRSIDRLAWCNFNPPRLQSIHSAAKDSPIIVVGTHADDPQCTEPYLKVRATTPIIGIP